MEEWEELLRKHRLEDKEQNSSEDGGARSAGSLIAQARELGVQADVNSPEADAENADALPEPVCLPDGYVRRSPVQAYRTPEGYLRRQIRKWVLILLGIALLVLLVVALIRGDIIRF